jgi:hypothetical protein
MDGGRIKIMTKDLSKQETVRDGTLKESRSIKSAPKSGTVRAKDVKRVVREVVHTRMASGNHKEPSPHKLKP